MLALLFAVGILGGGSPDTTPDDFAFDPVTGATPSSTYDSNVVTITGLTAPASVSATGGTVSINGGSQVSSGSITNGQTIRARRLASSSYSTLASTLVNIGGVTASFDVTTGADPAGSPITTTGPIVAGADRIVAVTPTGTSYTWAAPFDPSDRAPYAIDWTSLLREGEKIASIRKITMSAAGASVGVAVDGSTGRSPIIATDGLATQLWFIVDPAFQANAAFTAGVTVSVSVLVRTDATPYEEFERTVALTVRQQ